jgi:hypothetical protein
MLNMDKTKYNVYTEVWKQAVDIGHLPSMCEALASILITLK